MNAIFNRVSIRDYLDRPVEDEKINKLFQAAMAAPSAGNQQPWEFYVIQDQDMLKTISTITLYTDCCQKAPLAIVPCYHQEGLIFPDFAQIDMSNACENILLEAVELDLGGVWLGIAPRRENMDKLKTILHTELEPFAIIPIGYPKVKLQPKDRYDPKRIHIIELK